MKVGFVTPQVAHFDRFIDIAKEKFPDIHIERLNYQNFSEVPELLEEKQSTFDAVIFAGIVAKDYASKYVTQKTLWSSMLLSGTSVFRTLLVAMRSGYDIKNLCFDTFDASVLRDTYRDIACDIGENEFRCFKGDTLDPSYLDQVFAYHVDNYRNKGVSACVTGLQKVHERLTEEGIPNLIIFPVTSVMHEQLRFAQQFYQATIEAKGRIAGMMINLGYPSDYSMMLDGNDEFIAEKMKISQRIYRYASQLQAAVFEESKRDFLLLSTRDILALETKNYTRLSLLEWMEREVYYPVAVGIGLGDSVETAKKNAVRAMLQAQKHGKNAAYAHMGNGNVIGPIAVEKKDDAPSHIDAKLLKIAEKADLSVNKIYNLHRFLVNTQKDGYTSQEIATALECSKRNADRLLQRLEQLQYVSVAGKRIFGKAGRPVRILTFHKDLY